ncbi:hypothetical protein LX32DRAFT_649609 [Colletotrichum zoysiae]|uniref:Uncharacterized protein n=1 Tax=Colletotrichum zoysiae TaxID=1216348 RepID=A0AAD9M8N2_9PEZI|nr:hypothetical protein LX32DRAFT_649609 [Colletotrichum zoysiae]
MKSITLLITAATILGVQAQSVPSAASTTPPAPNPWDPCFSDNNSTLCFCNNRSFVKGYNQCLFIRIWPITINDTDGITKCHADGSWNNYKFSQCEFGRQCAGPATCS